MSTDSPRRELDEIRTSPFGESYLPAVNGTIFEQGESAGIFQAHFGDGLDERGMFHIVVGTDSGLLYRYIRSRPPVPHSQYLFIELPEIRDRLGRLFTDADDNLRVATEDDWTDVAEAMGLEKYALLGNVRPIRSLGVVHGHLADYAALWHRLSEQLRNLKWVQQAILESRTFIDCQLANLTENRIPATCLDGLFTDKTAVLLAGGPSLTGLLPWVREHRDDLVVIAVSRISGLLLEAGVLPDICVSVDPTLLNLHVSREMLDLPDDTLLVNNYHLVPALLASWKGPSAYVGSHYPWRREDETEDDGEIKGATVTNTAMNVATGLGVSQIVLGGVDLCFAQDGHSHAEGSREHAMGSLPGIRQQRVTTNDGREADTTHAFLSSGRSLERQAAQAVEQGCRVINPAGGAMRLENVDHVPLDEIRIAPLDEPAKARIRRRLAKNTSQDKDDFHRTVLVEVDRQLAALKEVHELTGKALKAGKRLLGRSAAEATKYRRIVERTDARLYGKYVNTTTFIKQYGLKRFADILRPDDETTESKETSELYFQAFFDTSSELIHRLRQTHARILSRMEEEKPHPDIRSLVTQWKQDGTTGRARQWQHTHPETAARLSPEERALLDDSQQAFRDMLEMVDKAYRIRLEQYADLGDVIESLRTDFRRGDRAGLLRTRATLKAHKDPQQAAQYLHLAEGMLAEQAGEQAEAIEHYSRVPDGPARLEAATHLFALYNEAGDLERARDMLQTLSDRNAAYQPLYADMLHATGETEAAVETYTDYLLAHPDDLDSMMKLGRIFLDAGSAEGVAWTMNYILEKDPGHAAARALVESLTQPQASSE